MPSLLTTLPLLAALVGGLAFASDQDKDDDKPAARPMPYMRCITTYSNMEHEVKDMEKANQEMEDAYNSRDLDEMGKASGRYDEAARDYNEQYENYEKGNCHGRTGKPAPDAPKKWNPK